MIEDQHIIDKLKQNDLTALDKVYITFKKEFFLFARAFSVSDEDIEDVYQDTMISFYENVESGKYNSPQLLDRFFINLVRCFCYSTSKHQP